MSLCVYMVSSVTHKCLSSLNFSPVIFFLFPILMYFNSSFMPSNKNTVVPLNRWRPPQRGSSDPSRRWKLSVWRRVIFLSSSEETVKWSTYCWPFVDCCLTHAAETAWFSLCLAFHHQLRPQHVALGQRLRQTCLLLIAVFECKL